MSDISDLWSIKIKSSQYGELIFSRITEKLRSIIDSIENAPENLISYLMKNSYNHDRNIPIEQIDFSNFNFINDLDFLINNDSFDIPNIIVSSLEYYLNLFKETNANFYQKEIEFFEQINKSIDFYKTINDTKEKIGILKETLIQLTNKLISTSNFEYPNDSLLILSNLLEKLKRYETKFLNQIYEQFKNNITTSTSQTKNNEILKSDLSKIKLVNTKIIDQQMFVILIIMLTILTVVGFYIITKKRLKKSDIEKVRKKCPKTVITKFDSETIPLNNNKVIKVVRIKQDNLNKESSQSASIDMSTSTSTSS